MPFPFTFRLSVPGLHNPFSAAAGAQPEPGLRQTPASDRHRARQTPVYHPSRISTQIPLPPHRRTFASTPYSLSPPVPLARKRGWVPSSPEPCQATTSATSTNGYLDTPAKYRHMPKREPEREMEEMIAGMCSPLIELRPPMSCVLGVCIARGNLMAVCVVMRPQCT